MVEEEVDERCILHRLFIYSSLRYGLLYGLLGGTSEVEYGFSCADGKV